MTTTRICVMISTLSTLFSGGCGDGDAPADDGPTYARDVQPILSRSCAGCHTEGGIAPFALRTYDDVAAALPLVREAVETRTMPPWPASPDCNSFSNDASLRDDERATVLEWIARGAPAGDEVASDAPPPAQGLSRIDRTLSLPEPYTPTLSPDEYRCFLIDWPEISQRYLTGYEVEPGNASIVHHVIVYGVEEDDVPTYEALDAADPAPGYACFGGPAGAEEAEGGSDPGLGAAWLASWAPGGGATELPEGTGIPISPGSKMVVQVHYNAHQPEAVEPDRTQVHLRLEDHVTSAGAFMPFTNIDWVQNAKMPIPAGQKDVVHTHEADPTSLVGLITEGAVPNGSLRMYTAGLHMHTLGTHARLALERQGAPEECLLDIPKWNFHWQRLYEFEESVVVKEGDRLSIECHWDSTGAKTDLNWGEGTGDEMCLGLFYVAKE